MERPSPSKRKKNEPGSLRARGLRLLASREHTRPELERKLAPYVEAGDDLPALLDEFTQRGWLSEARVVEQLIQSKRGRFGTARIRQQLLQRGVSGEQVGRAVENLKATELEAARSVWAKKFGSAARTRTEEARQVRFLQSRGFSIEVAVRVVRTRAGGDTGNGD